VATFYTKRSLRTGNQINS